MILIIAGKISKKDLQKVSEDLSGYIKFVVDVEKGIMAAGGTLQRDGEKLLLEEGSKQENLWGGGLDSQTNELDFESMINIRPSQNNPSREVLDPQTREKVKNIAENLLL